MLNKHQFSSFIRSTLIVLLVSGLISLSVWVFGGNYIASFFLATGLQYILFSFVANIINNYQIQKTKQKELDQLEMLSTILQCAYCQSKNVITFLPDQTERIEMKCDKCNKKSVVSIGFTVAQITEPVSDMPSLPKQKINS